MAKFNLGRDLTISVLINGTTINQFGLHIDTHFVPQWTEAKVRPTNNGGVFVARSIFGGYEITLQFARVNGVGDDLDQFLADNWVAGGADPVISMLETVVNTDGSTNQYNYINGTLAMSDAGSYKGVDEVNQTYKFFFPQRQAISASSSISYGGGPLGSGKGGPA